MKLPQPLLKFLKSKRIMTPTPIQLQGIPVACVKNFILHPNRVPNKNSDSQVEI